MTLVVVGGLPGTGKSFIAKHAARCVRAALVSKDVIEAALWRAGVGRDRGSGWAAYELMTALAEAQLEAGGSVVLDSVATFERIRSQWRELARRRGAAFIAIECVCSDAAVHRTRIEGRTRGIPGWPELSWLDVEEVASRYEPWSMQRLVVDALLPAEQNIARLEAVLGLPSGGSDVPR